MGERRPVIRHTQDSRCYVNSPTALLRSALPLCGAALAPRMNHRATSGRWKGPCWFGMLHERGVCQFGPGYPRLRRPTSSPRVTHLSDYSGCTMLFGMLALRNVVDRKLSLIDAWVCMCVCVSLCLCWVVTTNFGLLASQWLLSAKTIQICRQEKRTLFTLLYVSNENIKNNQFFIPNILLISQSNS